MTRVACRDQVSNAGRNAGTRASDGSAANRFSSAILDPDRDLRTSSTAARCVQLRRKVPCRSVAMSRTARRCGGLRSDFGGTSAWRIADGWNISEAQMRYNSGTNTVCERAAALEHRPGGELCRAQREECTREPAAFPCF